MKALAAGLMITSQIVLIAFASLASFVDINITTMLFTGNIGMQVACGGVALIGGLYISKSLITDTISVFKWARK